MKRRRRPKFLRRGGVTRKNALGSGVIICVVDRALGYHGVLLFDSARYAVADEHHGENAEQDASQGFFHYLDLP